MGTNEKSVWIATSQTTDFPKLKEDIETDTVVIGGGIAGITTAHMLEKKGVNTVIVEAGRLVKGVTGHTTAKVTALQGTKYSKIKSSFGIEKAQSYAEANKWAVNEVQDIIEELDIECGFQKNPAYTYASTSGNRDKIIEEADISQKAGLDTSREENLQRNFDIDVAVKLEDQAYFHPRKYLLGIIRSLDADIFENSRVESIDTGEPHKVETSEGSIKAENVVLATHFPVKDRGLYFARMKPQYSYAILITLREEIPEGMFIETGENFYSIRPGPYPKSLIVGGQGHPTGHADDNTDRYSKLEDWARQNFPVKSIDYRWSTQDYESIDHLPYIGELPFSDSLYIATGFGGWGMTNGTVSGKIISELIAHGSSKWEDTYDPSRLPADSVNTLKQLITYNLHTTKTLVSGRIRTSSDKVSSIEKGEAEVIEIDGDKVAVYRDNDGKLHSLSAVCTHMKCVVNWNSAEKTWDCPCHGSRFKKDGEVIDGPANTDLKEKDLT